MPFKGENERDLVFLVDGSQSVTLKHFAIIKHFIKSTIHGVDVGPHATQVSVVQVGGQPRGDIYLNSFTKKQPLLDAVNTIKNVGGPRNVGKALSFVGQEVLKPNKGSRPGVPKVCCHQLQTL